MELWTDSDVLEGGVGGRVGEEEIREDEGVDGEDLEARGGREEVGREGGAVEKRRSSRFVYFGEEDVLKRGSEVVEEILESDEDGVEDEMLFFAVANEELEGELDEVRKVSGRRK